MSPTESTRRTLVILLCRVAWADGIVRDEEREMVHQLAVRFMPELATEELDVWLDEGPPPAELETLPANLGQMFYYEAFRVMESDGELHEKELAMLERIMSTVFEGHPEGTPLMRIALERRAPSSRA